MSPIRTVSSLAAALVAAFSIGCTDQGAQPPPAPAAPAAAQQQGQAGEAAKEGLAADLDHYFAIRKALAGDTTEGVKAHAEALAKSKDPAIAAAAEGVARAGAIAAQRNAFGDLSKAALAAVERAAGREFYCPMHPNVGGTEPANCSICGMPLAERKAERPPKVYLFHCPMTQPYGNWLQESDAIGNPYWGAKMLKCGTVEKTIGG